MPAVDSCDVAPEIMPLDLAIREYMTRLDAGETVARGEFLAAHPDLSEGLQAFFETSDLVRRMSGVPVEPGDTSVSTQHATIVSLPGTQSGPQGSAADRGVSRAFAGPFPMLFGQYRVLRALGQGAMGEVYLAEDVKLSRKVALKVPQRSVAENPDQLARFTREAQACAGLRHHNICPVYEVNEIGGIHYIAMAFIEGQPLSEHIRERRQDSPRQIADTVRKIALALDVAHRAGVVHRDLKPANVMVDQDGEPIVMDFGLARQLNCAEQSRLTQDGMILGTPSYMSPEQVRSELDRVGPASDVYSLGVILYELLTGRLPFSGPLMTMLTDVANEQRTPPKPSDVCPDVDPELAAICLRMLSKAIGDRYGTMKEVAAVLTEFLERSKAVPEAPATPQAAAPDPVATPATTMPAPGAAAADRKPQISNLQSEISNVKSQSADSIRPPGARRALALAGLGALLLAGVIVITIKNRDGSQTKIEVPGTSEVSITRKGDNSSTSSVPGPSTLDPRPSSHGWPADAPKPAIAPFDAAQAKKHQEEWAAYLKIPVEHTNSIGMKFRLIPPGEFRMGSSAEEIDEALKVLNPVTTWEDSIRSEAPRHRVVLTQPIYLGVHEVTQGEYEKVMGTNPSYFARTGPEKEYVKRVEGLDTAAHPVEYVSLNDAAEFCAKLSQQEKLKPHYFRAGETATLLDGDGYRLPTEADWEYSCRAGTTTKFWIGEKDDDVSRAGWLARNSGGRTHAVGELKANPLGLFDMHGNVYEWVQDEWDPAWYGRFKDQPAVDPTRPSVGGDRPIFRGGYWGDTPSLCRAALRKVGEREYRGLHIGFRVALPVGAGRGGADRPK